MVIFVIRPSQRLWYSLYLGISALYAAQHLADRLSSDIRAIGQVAVCEEIYNGILPYNI